MKTLRTLVSENTWQSRFAASPSFVFAAIALNLSAVGIYGVAVYITSAYRRDFGVRAALGAKPSNLLRLAALQTLTPFAIGSCVGALCFYPASKWIASLHYDTSRLDPVNPLACLAILLVVTAAAIAGSALNAARVDPAITLRVE